LTSGGRALGIGLLAGAGIVTLLMLLWLGVSGASGGGIVLGLLLLAVIAGPLAGAGWFVLARQPAEERAAAQFASNRRVLESDRAFRRDIGAELRTLADRSGAPSPRLLELARSVETSNGEVVQLDDAQIDTLRRYDDLVWQRVRHMRDTADWNLADLQRSLDQRQDLLTRGRLAPGVDATALLRAGARRSNLADVALGDAVSRGPEDFLVESLVSYFADGKRWKMAHLVPTSGAPESHWLYVAPGETTAALLDEVTSIDQSTLQLTDSGTAVADVASESGAAQGVLVAFQRFSSGAQISIVERWPNDETRTYTGQTIGPIDLEVWPAAPTAPS
jgi:hypothetical protein